MDLNPRVDPTALLEALGWAGVQVPALHYESTISFDATADAALITAGQSKVADWHVPYYPDDIVTLGPCCAFQLYASITASNNAYVYNDAAEIRFAASSSSVNFTAMAYAWLWPGALLSGASKITDRGPATASVMAYEGAPVTPRFWVRCGIAPGISDPGTTVTISMNLIVLPQAVFGSTRLQVPSPYCAPPFVPVGGSHIFYDVAAAPMPSQQIFSFPRQFRSTGIVTAPDVPMDARILGGPWSGGHMIGSLPGGAATSSWEIQALMGSVDDTTYDAPTIVSAGPDENTNMHTPPNQMYGGLRFMQTDDDNASTNQLLVEYLGG